MSFYIHNTPGRLRIKSPIIRRNENASYEVRKILGATNGIATVDANLTTGSLLINYNPKVIKHDDIIDLLQRKGYFDKDKAVTHDQYIKGAASKAGSFIGRSVLGSVVGMALEGTPLAVLALLI
ncbi:MAG: HMA2 domain-containing protein [Dissulfurispiraceae bacterium]